MTTEVQALTLPFLVFAFLAGRLPQSVDLFPRKPLNLWAISTLPKPSVACRSTGFAVPLSLRCRAAGGRFGYSQVRR